MWTDSARQAVLDLCAALKGTDGAKGSGNVLALLAEAKFLSRWGCILCRLGLAATTDERLTLAG